MNKTEELLKQRNTRTTEQLAASESSGLQWENDLLAICKVLGVKSDSENAECASGVCLEKIEALKHVAIEIAAYGDCCCSELDNHLCVHCVAIKVIYDMPKTRQENEYVLKQ